MIMKFVDCKICPSCLRDTMIPLKKETNSVAKSIIMQCKICKTQICYTIPSTDFFDNMFNIKPEPFNHIEA